MCLFKVCFKWPLANRHRDVIREIEAVNTKHAINRAFYLKNTDQDLQGAKWFYFKEPIPQLHDFKEPVPQLHVI